MRQPRRQAARAEGFDKLTADELAENGAMRHLLRSCGYGIDESSAGCGEVAFAIDLRDTRELDAQLMLIAVHEEPVMQGLLPHELSPLAIAPVGIRDTGDSVVHQAPCPILVVPRPAG